MSEKVKGKSVYPDHFPFIEYATFVYFLGKMVNKASINGKEVQFHNELTS